MHRLYDEILEKQNDLRYDNSYVEERDMPNSRVKERDVLNKAAAKLELLAQAIRDRDKELFDNLTYDADDAYCQGVGIVANVDLDDVHSIIFRSI